MNIFMFRTFCRSRLKFAYFLVNKKVVHVVGDVRYGLRYVRVCTSVKKKLREEQKLVKKLCEWVGKWFKPFFCDLFLPRLCTLCKTCTSVVRFTRFIRYYRIWRMCL